MPDAVPPNISQTFKDVIPFAACVLILTIFDFFFRKQFDICFAQAVIQVFQPLFTAADGYVGLAIIYGAMAMFWFVGIQGPSIVEPAVSAIYYVNIANNLQLYQAGKHAANILTVVLAVVSRESEGTYGYKITQDVRAVLEVSESTLYPVLRRLKKDGCLEVYDKQYGGRNRRYYKITSLGTAQLELYKEEWKQYSRRISGIFEGFEGGEEV